MGDKALVKETLVTARDYISKVKAAIDGMITNISKGEDYEFHSTLTDLSDGIEWLLDVDRLLEKVGSGYSLGIDRAKYLEILTGIVEAQNNQDLILIGDLLEYEIVPLIDDYNKAIVKLMSSGALDIDVQ